MIREEFKDINWLKANHQMIHYFGLGFIQLKIDNTYRMHFYTESLPAIVSQEDVHNHRYSFFSEIVKGKLLQELYQITDGDTHIKEQETCKAGIGADGMGVKCGLKETSRHRYFAGSRYWLNHDTFHRVWSANAITLLTRGEIEKELAEVVRPVNAPKICPFSKKVE